MRRLLSVIGLTALMTALIAPAPASAIDTVNTTQLRNAVTVGGILAHERALQQIANNNGGTRASGTPGFTASVNYVSGQLKAAGYAVRQQSFTFPFFRDTAPPSFAEVTPTARTIPTATFQYSGSGDVTGRLFPAKTIDTTPGDPGTTNSGCSAADFTAAPAGPSVALVQRGTCTFEDKANFAQAAGYDAVVIFNEGQEGRTDIDAGFPGTLGNPETIPVIGISFADGVALYNQTRAGAVTVHVTTATETNLNARTTNVIVDTPGGNPDKVLVVGAHLDSVVAGPGINDNGSGSATILEIARQMAALKIVPRQKVRFIFFGAEEEGLLGSENYVSTLPPAQLAKIYANLNFDMLGSPNYVRFVYDGDGNGPDGVAGPAGSAQIETLFTSYFASQNLPTAPTAFDGRSDYGPFIAAGIPAGGLFSGAEGIKTPAEARVYGGTAGQPYDSCYHQACDTANNLSTKALNELGDGAAHAVLTLAQTRSGFFEDGSLRRGPYQPPVFDRKGGRTVR